MLKLISNVFLGWLVLLILSFGQAGWADEVGLENIFQALNSNTAAHTILGRPWEAKALLLKEDPDLKTSFLKLAIHKIKREGVKNPRLISVLSELLTSPQSEHSAKIDIESGLMLASVLRDRKKLLEGQRGFFEKAKCLGFCDPTQPKVRKEIDSFIQNINAHIIHLARNGDIALPELEFLINGVRGGYVDLIFLSKVTYLSRNVLFSEKNIEGVFSVLSLVAITIEGVDKKRIVLPDITESKLDFLRGKVEWNLTDEGKVGWSSFGNEFSRLMLEMTRKSYPERTLDQLCSSLVTLPWPSPFYHEMFESLLSDLEPEKLSDYGWEFYEKGYKYIDLRALVLGRLASLDPTGAVQHSREIIEQRDPDLELISFDLKILEKYGDKETLSALADKLALIAEQVEKLKNQKHWALAASRSAAKAALRGYGAGGGHPGSVRGLSPSVFSYAVDEYTSGSVPYTQILGYLSRKIRETRILKGEVVDQILRMCDSAVTNGDTELIQACAGPVLEKMIASNEILTGSDRITRAIYQLVGRVADFIENPQGFVSCHSFDLLPIISKAKKLFSAPGAESLRIDMESGARSGDFHGLPVKIGDCADVLQKQENWGNMSFAPINGSETQILDWYDFYEGEGKTAFVSTKDKEGNLIEIRLCNELFWWDELEDGTIIGLLEQLRKTAKMLATKTNLREQKFIDLAQEIEEYQERWGDFQRDMRKNVFTKVQKEDAKIMKICNAAENSNEVFVRFLSPKK